MHRALRSTAARGIRGVAIHPVLGGIDVDRRKIGGAELVEGIENLAELVGFIGLAALGDDFVQALEDPTVEQSVFQVGRMPTLLETIEVA